MSLFNKSQLCFQFSVTYRYLFKKYILGILCLITLLKYTKNTTANFTTNWVLASFSSRLWGLRDKELWTNCLWEAAIYSYTHILIYLYTLKSNTNRCPHLIHTSGLSVLHYSGLTGATSSTGKVGLEYSETTQTPELPSTVLVVFLPVDWCSSCPCVSSEKTCLVCSYYFFLLYYFQLVLFLALFFTSHWQCWTV